MDNKKYYTRRELKDITEAPGYLISYLKDCGRLPIILESRGRGFPILYHPDSVKVIRDHMRKQIDG